MLIGNYPIRREGSQGQSKTFLIALKLAQFEFIKNCNNNKSPILLLDDIFDKLDANRVSNIINIVSKDSFGQIFITDTNREHLDIILQKTTKGNYKIYRVSNGTFNEE
jgi:DNA replication and repair protein RecF